MKQNYEIGDMIKIISMEDEPAYTGRCGVIERIDDIGQLHGTWGGLAVIPGVDTIKIIEKGGECNEKTNNSNKKQIS